MVCWGELVAESHHTGVEVLLSFTRVIFGSLRAAGVSVCLSVKWETVIQAAPGHGEVEMRLWVEFGEHRGDAPAVAVIRGH